MQQYEIFEHSGETCPVPGKTKVRYRTIDKDGCISNFWHKEIEARYINWGFKSHLSSPLGLGRIYDYVVWG